MVECLDRRWWLAWLLALSLAGCSLSPAETASPPPPAPGPAGTPEASLLPSATQPPPAPAAASPTAAYPSPEPAAPSLTPTVTPTPSPTRLPFHYVFPVQPQRNAGFSQGGHAYPATDIFAPAGSRFVAVIDGVVDFVSTVDLWNPQTANPADRGGLSVAIVGVDGVRYYGSHLSEIALGIEPGVRVQAGQELGIIGNTGDAAGKEIHLHFGISPPTYPTDWHSRRGLVDPYPYLKAWKAGYGVTPVLANLTLTPSPR